MNNRTIVSEMIGIIPENKGEWDPTRAYAQDNRVLVFNSEVESLHDNNVAPPAYFDEETGRVVFNLEHWRVISDNSAAWLITKDKAYSPNDFSGLGKVVLKKNIQEAVINGETVKVNLLTQDMFYKDAVVNGETVRVPNTNTIFVIQYDFALGASIKKGITIPQSAETFIGSSHNITIDTTNSVLIGHTHDILITSENSVEIDGTTYYYTAVSLANGMTIKLLDTENCVLLDELQSLVEGDTITAVGDNVIYIASTDPGTYNNAYKLGAIYYYQQVSLSAGYKLVLNDTSHCVLLDSNFDVLPDTEIAATSDMTVTIASTLLGTYSNAYKIGNVYYYEGVNLSEGNRFDLLNTTDCVLLNNDHNAILDTTSVVADEDQMVYIASKASGLYSNVYKITEQNIITIPENCVFEFDGGSISNGTIEFDNTILIYNQQEEDVLKNITMVGDYEVSAGGKGDKKDNINGMGKIYLKKNKGFAEQLTQNNTIYVIQYDFNLGGQTITVPANCMLKFEGGSLDNGVLIGNKTRIDAPSYQIFGNNLALFKYGYYINRTYDHYIKNIAVPMEYVVNNGVIDLTHVVISDQIDKTVFDKIITTDGYERNSVHNGIGTISDIGNTLDIKTDLILSHKVKVNFNNYHDATGRPANLNGTYIFYFKGNSDSTFTIPNRPDGIFFDSNGDKLSVGDVVSESNVYFSYANKLISQAFLSSFIGKAKLSWFIGNNCTDDLSQIGNISDVTDIVQKAFSCYMDIESDIKGFIRISDSLYLDTPKTFDFGQNEAGVGISAAQGQYMTPLNKRLNDNYLPYTVFCQFANKPILYIRNSNITVNGGKFTSEYGDEHDTSLCCVDCTYLMSNIRFNNVTLKGKTINTYGLSTEKGIEVLLNDRGEGFCYNAEFRCFIQNTKYPVYKEPSERTQGNIAQWVLDLYVWGFYEALHADGLSDATIKLEAQATACIPVADIDNYRLARITNVTGNTSIDAYFWDALTTKAESIAKALNGYTRGYRKAIVSGSYRLSSRCMMEPNYYWELVEKGHKDIFSFRKNTDIIATSQFNNRHYALTNIMSSLMENISSSTSYLNIYEQRDGFTDVQGPTSGVSGVTPTSTVSYYLWNEQLKNTTAVNSINITAAQYAEFYIKPSIGDTFNLGANCDKFGLISTPANGVLFKNYQIVFKTQARIEVVSGEVSGDNINQYILNGVNTWFTDLYWVVIRLWNPATPGIVYLPKIKLFTQNSEIVNNRNSSRLDGTITQYSKGKSVGGLLPTYAITGVDGTNEYTKLREAATYLSGCLAPDTLIILYGGASSSIRNTYIYNKNRQEIFNLDGTDATMKKRGTYAQRPSLSVFASIPIGFAYFATDKGAAGVGAMIYYTGDNATPWVYADGTAVS